MSVQAGVFCRDLRPVDAQVVTAVRYRLSAVAPDGGDEYVSGHIAMVYRGLHVTPEDLYERQPFQSRSGRRITWDGRLDNRDDLMIQLWRTLDKPTADVEIAVAAYDRWGDEGLGRLIGDWSLAIWDETDNVLTLASDYTGNRSLYYAERGDEVHWSTSMAELVQRLNIQGRLDPRFVIGYLTGTTPPDVTPYPRVSAVSPAHVVSWNPSRGRRVRRYWDLAVGSIRYSDVRDYEVHLRSLFAEAVRARLRSTRPVWAELSGGFDSSSVVCMADRLLAAGAACAPSLETVSLVSDSSRDSDERPFISAVEAQRGREGHHLRVESTWDLLDVERGWASPVLPHGTNLAMFRVVSQHGGRVLLSGHPGDLVMMNFPEETGGITEALAAGELWRAVARAHDWCHACRRPMWHLAYQLAMLSVRPGRAMRALRYDLSGVVTARGDVIQMASEAFHLTRPAARVWADEALRRSKLAAHVPEIGKRMLLKRLYDMTQFRLFQTPSETTIGVTYCHPYLARPLVEFVLAVPIDVMCQPGRPRLLMKDAWSEILPPRVAKRFSKGDAGPVGLRSIRSWIPSALARPESLYLVRESHVDRDRLLRAFQSVMSGNCRETRNLRAIVKFEQWVAMRGAADSGVDQKAKGGEQLCTTSQS